MIKNEKRLVQANIINKGETELTPIEVMLDIQEDGTTTARKLYDYLQLDKSHFNRWCKRNITENLFAIENTDFVRLATEGETPTGGKITKEDYKITASFAKKLCMTSQTPRGEEARNYFIKIEDILKEKAQQQNALTNKQELDFNNKIMFVTNVINQMATATSQYMELMAEHEKEFKTEVKELVRDSIIVKDHQIEQISELIGIRDVNTKHLVQFLKEKLSNLTDSKINANNPLYVKIKNKIFRKYKVFRWESISANRYNSVFAYIDGLEKEDLGVA